MINFKKSKEKIILLTNLNGVPIQNLTELGNEYLKMQDLIKKYKQALKEIRENVDVWYNTGDERYYEIVTIINEVLNET